jgi:hypothetical protein
VAQVSGEATGCHTEIEANIALLQGGAVTAQDVAAQASSFLGQIPTGGTGYLNDLLAGLQGQINNQAAKVTAADSEGEDALFHQEAGPVPTVKLPWQGGGPVTDEEGDCTLDLFGLIHIPLAGDLKVGTEGAIGAQGFAHTEAQSSDNLGLIYTADEVDTECVADLSGLKAWTQINDGQYEDIDLDNAASQLKDIPENPDPNEELIDVEFKEVDPTDPTSFLTFELSLTANEQDKSDNAINVTGLHSKLAIGLTIAGQEVFSLTVDGIKDQSHCDLHPESAPLTAEPKFTG